MTTTKLTPEERREAFDKETDLIFEVLIPKVIWPAIKFPVYTAPKAIFNFARDNMESVSNAAKGVGCGVGWVAGGVGRGVKNSGKFAGNVSYNVASSSSRFLKNNVKNISRVVLGTAIGISSVLYLKDIPTGESKNDVVDVLEKTVEGVNYVTPIQRDGRSTPFVSTENGLARLDLTYNSDMEAIQKKYEGLRKSKRDLYNSIQNKANKIMGNERK